MQEIKKTLSETGRMRVRKPLPVSIAMETGKLPPQAVDLEEAVLGALMLEKEALNDVIDILSSPKSFYKEEHQKIYAVIQDLFNQGKPIDILTVTETLKSRAELDFVGGPYYISQLTSRVASSAHTEFHARIISQKHILRELIRISSETIRDSYDDTSDVFDLLDKAEKGLYDITQGNIRKEYEKMTDIIDKTRVYLEMLSKQKEGLSGVPSGFTDLDRFTSGFQKSDLIVIAARPGMGKTAFVLSLARNTAIDHKKPVGLFSLEMSTRQLAMRLISSETELDADKLRRGKLENYEWEQLITKVGKLGDAPIFIDDTPALSVYELRAKCRRMKAKHNVEMIIVDYLQLMTVGGDGKNSKGGNREQEISLISRSMKNIAKELDIPVIALSQLNRNVEKQGGNKRPQLSDLRESGAIEQDADIVAFLYRPEYYGITQDEQGNNTEGQTEVIIAKHRNGATGSVKLRFISKLSKFTDWENYYGIDADSSSGNSDDSSSNNIIRGSRMNEMDDEPGGGSPF